MDELLHVGVKRRSGRYPWGSGEEPHQHDTGFLREYEKLKAKGLGETAIAEQLGINTTQLRNNITWARKAEREFLQQQVGVLKESGMTNVMIADKLNISEATVRNYANPAVKNEKVQLDTIKKAVLDGVEKTGYLDVGVGVERQLGISRDKFNKVVAKLEEEGYTTHEIYVKRLSDPTKYTTVKVLTKEGDIEVVKKNSDKIKDLDSFSDDNGMSVNPIKPPQMVDLNRIKVRYAEDGGADKDGLIELRSGVDDLDLGASKYAQVRIGAGDNLYLKGMVAYTDDKDFPKGVDIIFNTNKAAGTPVEKVLKEMKKNPNETDDPGEMFGTSITKQKGALNIVNEQGDWDTWSTKMSSQFLSKQPVTLVKDRLDATFAGLKSEYDEIASLTNPVVKKHLMDKYVEGLDAKAAHLKAQGIARTKNHVLLPINDIKPNEVYAPNFSNGERVVLVRHPHGGVFEIPDLVVNNKVASAKKIIGNKAPDAIGIHPSVAGKLSGADFDGDTVLVIPNKGNIKTSRSLKELANWGDEMHVKYKRDYDTIAPRTKQIQMGIVSNLITDMTIKGASQAELARAVKHSMVVIDSEKHKLDYKQSARDNGISSLRKKYQTHVNPDTGKISNGASTLISVSKRKVDISDPSFNPDKYSSGTAVESLYSGYIKNIQSLKNTATKTSSSITMPKYSKDAAKVYEPELKSLNQKLNTALLNAPKERQAQLLTNNLYYKNLKPDMDPDAKKKLKARSLATARVEVGAKKTAITITDREWEAIQSRAVSTTKLTQILNNSDMDVVRKLATPKQSVMTSAMSGRAKAMLSNGATIAEVSQALGVSTSTVRDAIN